MFPPFPTSFRRFLSGALLSVAGAGALVAEEDVRDLEILELQTQLSAVLARHEKQEEALKSSLNANRVLAQSLAQANEEARELGENYQNALLHLELLGNEAFQADGKGLQERLKKAASDLRLAEEEKDKLARALMALAGRITEYMKEAVHSDAEARLNVEKALREGDEALGLIFREAVVTESGMHDAKVISIQNDFRLVVLNVGRAQGMRVGTPIRIFRKDRAIASALVVDVRDIISGAIILDVNDTDDSIQIDDSVRVDPKGA